MIAPRRQSPAIVAAVTMLMIAGIAAAQTSPNAPTGEATNDADQKLEKAKALFRSGRKVLDTGDNERALDLFLRSRELVPSWQNTMNAAWCLYALQRFDEALELYEELLTRFGSELDEEVRSSIGPRMQELRRKLGSVEVSANVAGAVLIDGRTRGTLPRYIPIRVLPGSHTVRVMKEGYDTFEQQINVRIGETTFIDAKLKPLGSSESKVKPVGRVGRLRVEAPDLAGATLYIDGAEVGELPWEGALTTGEHLYYVRKGPRGSAPRRVAVLEGQTIQVAVETALLGPELHISIEPSSADLLIDGVLVAKGRWRGWLPLGEHRLEAREKGYFAGIRTIRVAPRIAGTLSLKLQVNRADPSWRLLPWGEVGVDVLASRTIAASLGSDAESSCGVNSDCPPAYGTMAAMRGRLALSNGLFFEVGGGYLGISRHITRRIEKDFGPVEPPTHARYTFRDNIELRGVFGSAGIGWRYRFNSLLSVGARLHLGGVALWTYDSVSGSASAGGSTIPAIVTGSGATIKSGNFLAMPDVELKFTHDSLFTGGSLYTGIGIATLILPLSGPQNHRGETIVEREGASCKNNPPPIACAPGETFLAKEKTYGPLLIWVPNVTMGFSF